MKNLKMNKLPIVSIIMPVRNEAGYIGRSVGSVLAQDYPPDRMEILVGGACPRMARGNMHSKH